MVSTPEQVTAINQANKAGASTGFPTDRGTKQNIQPPVPPHQERINPTVPYPESKLGKDIAKKGIPIDTRFGGGGSSGGGLPQTSPEHPTPSASVVIGEVSEIGKPATAGGENIYTRIGQAQIQGKDIYVSDTGLLFTGMKGQSPYASYGSTTATQILPGTTPITQSVIPFSQVNIGASLFPDSFKLTVTKPYLLQEYFDYKIVGGLNKLTEQYISPNVPEQFKFLTEEKYSFSPTTLIKTSVFSPTTLTTTQTYQDLLAREVITPVSETQFRARITPTEENFYNVFVKAETQIGGKTYYTISQQTIKDVTEDISTGYGKGIIYSDILRGGFGDTEKVKLTEFNILGATQNIGEASIIKLSQGLRTSVEIGTAVRGYSVSQYIAEANIQKGLIFPFPKELPIINIKDLETFKLGFPITPTGYTIQPILYGEKVTGVVRPLETEGLYGFLGKTGETELGGLGRYGFKEIIREPNIKGIIKFNSQEDFESTFYPSTSRQVQQSKIIEKSISSQLSSNIARASKSFGETAKELPTAIQSSKLFQIGESVVSSIKTIPSQVYVRDFERLKTIQLSTQLFNQSNIQKSLSKSNLKQEQDLSQLQRQIPLLSQPSLQQQKQQTRQLFQYSLLQEQEQYRTRLTTPKIIPTTFYDIPPFLFGFGKGKRKKGSKKKGKGRQSIAYTPSFTAQVLGIKRKVSRKELYGEAGRFRTGAEIRGVLRIK
jgi:hypothetical protein